MGTCGSNSCSGHDVSMMMLAAVAAVQAVEVTVVTEASCDHGDGEIRGGSEVSGRSSIVMVVLVLVVLVVVVVMLVVKVVAMVELGVMVQ